jgi:hypothetical protein
MIYNTDCNNHLFSEKFVGMLDLKSLKKEKTEEIIYTESYHRHVVVGEDFYALATYHELWRKHGASEVLLVMSNDIDETILSFQSPSTFRGENNLNCLSKLYPEMSLKIQESKNLFYKELKLRQFGGRNKNEPLLWGEDFYTGPKADLDMSEVFSWTKDQAFIEHVKESKVALYLSEIASNVDIDMDKEVKNTFWSIKSTQNKTLNCEWLYFGNNPRQFRDLFTNDNNKNSLSSDFYSYCEELIAPCSLRVKLVFNEEITPIGETVFIPLSFTHEWGHFIGEFKSFDTDLTQQKAEFLCFLNKDESTEEDVSKKIKILKRNLEKIFPGIIEKITLESIILKDDTACLNFDNYDQSKLESEFRNLFLVGCNAPIKDLHTHDPNCEYSIMKVSHETRGLHNLKNLSLQFS